jgi:glycosyltransferase involved in cell wall biosynthesis
MKISVCLATFNGSKFINRQLNSILCQLCDSDEIVIVDDASTDNTISTIKKIKSPLIKLYINTENIGPASTFNRALGLASGDIIFLSDQDDIWEINKISYIKNLFSITQADLIVHNAFIVINNKDSKKTLFDLNKSRPGIFKNIYRNTYTGCCMVFKRKVLKKIMPISSNIGLFHDAWIGILSEIYGFNILFVEVPLVKFMRHGANSSSFKRRGLVTPITDRFFFIFEIFIYLLSKRR